jgi:hypothetical protein
MFKTLHGLKKNSATRKRSKPTERFRLQVEQLEDRRVPTGTWTVLNHAPPADIGTMMLLTDGTVMAQSGYSSTDGFYTRDWYRLTPDATGSYLAGTWSQLASMNDTRLYYGSAVLRDGRVFVAGGEYGTGTSTVEIYGPLSNTWSSAPDYAPGAIIRDATAVNLADGRVLVAPTFTSNCYIYNPATNSWVATSAKLYNDANAEESFVQLPDGSLLTVDVGYPGGNGLQAQKYIPSEDRWVSAGTLPAQLVDGGYEIGPGLLLPDGRAFYIGATGHTALYTPGSNRDDPGSWQAGPDIPGGLGADDAPAALLPNGHVLLAADHGGYSGPTGLFEYDPTTNTMTSLPSPGADVTAGPSYTARMLVLPTGQVLLSDSWNSGNVYIYTPDGSPANSWKPRVASVTANVDGSYHLTGTQLNGLSEGAYYGDDATMSSNYPIVRLVSGTGQVYYARTSNFSTMGVATGSATVSADFTLPAGVPNGTYSLYAVANGIASDSFTFTIGAGNNQPSDPGFETPVVGNNFFGAFQYDPTGSPWTFAGGAGVSGNNSGFTSGNPSAPQGSQVAFLQGSGSQVSQSVNFTAGSYTLSFQAAQRGNYQASSQTFEVLVDSTVVGMFTPASTSYASLTTNAFTVSAGAHTIAFVGLNPNGGDNTAFVDDVQVNAVVTNQPSDPGFETPVVGNNFFGAFQYDPTGSPWTFSGGAGVSGNNSGFTAGNPAAPQDSQVGFLQSGGSQISQAVSFTAGSYTLSFQAAQRGNYQASSQTFEVLIDGTVVGTFTPASTSYATFTTSAFTLSAGSHTIAFLGLNPNGGDNTAFIDDVHVNTVTAPTFANAGFESPNVGTGSFGSFAYDPTGAGWTFNGGAGVAGNNSGFTSGNPNAPDGTQVGFLQQTGSFSQAVDFGAGGSFAISFQAAQRGNYQASFQTFQVLVDNTVVGTFTPGSTSYSSFTTTAFSLGAGTHTVSFVGLNPNGGDNTAFVDAVRINIA